MTVTVHDLLLASELAYKGLMPPALARFEVIASERSAGSNHSAVALYCEASGELIVAHRGTEMSSLRDLLVTDVQILFKRHTTGADVDALNFSEQAVQQLIGSGRPLNQIYQTGHSKGGHEAQVCTSAMIRQGLPVLSVTFNSAAVHEAHQGGECNYHLNIRAACPLIGDVVSNGPGCQLGEGSIDVAIPAFRFAHLFDSVAEGLHAKPKLRDAKVIDLWQYPDNNIFNPPQLADFVKRELGMPANQIKEVRYATQRS